MVRDAEPAWSDQTWQARWIGKRLARFDAYVVTSVVPAGFEAYARVLHPAEEPLHGGDRVVRWAEVAAWSGLPLRPGSQFHSIALPRIRPEREAPWASQGPHRGSLYPPDAVILAGILRGWTTTPQQCWFGVWDGYGWDGEYLTASDETAAAEPVRGRRPDPVPGDVRRGSRVRLPNRDYLLHRGPVEAALNSVGLGGEHQVANLWWPQDRSWFVATEIDLAWTYVGGPAGLIGQLLAETRIEALPAAPDGELDGIEDWVTAQADQTAGQLLSSGQATVTTSRGTLRASLEHPGRPTSGTLHVRMAGDNGVTGSSSTRLSQRPGQDLREQISRHLARDIIELAGG
ncbi:MAG TPA: hypothetical protein VMF87_24505 [Streptosporangiaceae bacterium]|nr:hypothetical protein [Streptosporangiaceae bacterium]